jgi:trimeric autotransporter adhesin
MALPTGLNDLAKLTLLASDTSYFDNAHPAPTALGSLDDTSYEQRTALYSVPAGFIKAIEFNDTATTGFGFVAYVKVGATAAESEVIIALRGTDGLNPTDWVANSQSLGWNQWNQQGRAAVFNFLNSLKLDPLDERTAFAGQIHFTGQSLGGGLAQYAAYQYVQSHQGLTGFGKSNVTLTTFNGFGGVLGLQQNAGGYNPAILADIGSNAHFYTEGDLVSRLGSFGGVGHTGGTTYLLNAHATEINPNTGEPYLLNAIKAHRIETGFYPFLQSGVEFEAAMARPIDYLPIQHTQQMAALFGRLFNDQDVSPLESAPRLAAGLITALSLGDRAELNALAKAVFTNLHSAGQMPDEWYVTLQKYDWGALAGSTAFKVPAAAGYGVALLGAMLSDALEFQVDRHAQLFNNIQEWVSNAVPTLSQGISDEDRRVQVEMMMALVPGAAIGSKLASVLQPLNLDINQFAQTLATTGENWLRESLDMIRERANALGHNLGTLSATLTSAIADIVGGIGASPAIVQDYVDTVLIPFVRDTAQGISNAVTDYVQDVAGAFDLGRALNFSDIQLIDQAYAAELNDPRLSTSARAAIEEARDIVQRAGQTVVIQAGVGSNPFGTPNFNPSAAPPATVTIHEGQWQTISIYLPYEAGTGGQHLRLILDGAHSSSFVLRTDVGELTQANGGFEVVVPEGARQISVHLWTKEPVSSGSSLSLSAELTTAAGVVTHEPGKEGVVALADAGTILNGDEPVINYSNGQQSVTYVGDGDNNSPSFNAGANHVVYGNGGFDVLNLSRSIATFNHQVFGGIGNDALYGGEGKDRLYGEEGFDYLSGGGGRDVLFGGDSGDRLLGDSGDPSLVNSVPGDDYLDGGLGDDRIEGQAGNDILHGGLGNDMLLGDDHAIYVDRPVGNDYLNGGDGNDYLFGGRGDDQLLGGQGDDFMRGDNQINRDPDLIFTRVPGSVVLSPTTENAFATGEGGEDYLDGGDGNDTIQGDGGDDLILGGDGNDKLYGDEDLDVEIGINWGNDWIEGGEGNDRLNGDEGADALFGGAGDDFLLGDYLNEAGFADYLDGGAGADTLVGTKGDDVLIGGDGEDILAGGDDNDVLDGGNGDDGLYGELGDDILDGGEGNDTLLGELGNDVLDGGEGKDLLIGSDGDDELDGGNGVDELQGGRGDDVLVGGAEGDLLLGNAGEDVAFGGDGDDEIQGNDGSDLLIGETGNDVMWGGLGEDLLEGGVGDDALVGDNTDLSGGIGGDDILDGGQGNDYLGGSGGRDTYLLNPGDGYDVIRDFAFEGNRIVFGAGISPTAIIVTVGPNDSLVIRSGSGDTVEILNFGTANLTGSHPIDTFEFSDGTILTYGQLVAAAGGLGISGGFGNDQLMGTAQGERIYGGIGNDTIESEQGADTLLGEAGQDVLVGGLDNDLLLGGTGNDRLIGGGGLDTYYYRSGWGIDRIQDSPGEGNRLVFGAGITEAELSFDVKQVNISEESEEASPVVIGLLVVGVGLTGDFVEVEGFDLANPMAPLGIDRFEFADGSVLTYAELLTRGFELVGTSYNDTLNGVEIYRTLIGLDGNDVLIGGGIDNILRGGKGRDALLSSGGSDQLFGGLDDDVLRGGEGDDTLMGEDGIDSLEGEAGDDVLVGGIGNDQLYGGAGSDTYRYNLGDGTDSIFDSGPSADLDTVTFGAGITATSVSLKADGSQILLRVSAGGIYIGNTFDVSGSQTIERFQLADGTVLSYADLVARGIDIDGTEFDDWLFGSNVVDRFHGGLGNDRLEGGEGQDAYFFNVGDGVDTIVDTGVPGAANEVVFGPGITPADLSIDLAPDQSDSNLADVLIRVGVTGDALQLDTFDRNNVLGPRTVGTFRFADGSTLTYEHLLARGFDLTGTAGDDQITGTNTTDRLVGLDGADMLRAEAGDDTLDGGADNDSLIGGQGSDTYLFGPGSGQDLITDTDGTLDRITMAVGVSPSDIVVTQDQNDLILSLNGGVDRLTIAQYFLSSIFQVERIEFAGGTVWNQADIENLVNPAIRGTGGHDVLVGTSGDDRLFGLAGNDQLTGLGGHDRLDGGTGADQLIGGLGNDTYVIDAAGDVVTELLNEGRDTVQAAVTYQLTPNVENLTLTGNTAINGTGNNLDNVLTGNSAANVLAGGQGNDTYVIGVGDTVVELAGEGTDTVRAAVNTTLGANLENLTLTGSSSLVGIGNSLDNVLSADGSVSILMGGGGHDTYVIGPNGDDDILVETAGGGIDRVMAAHDYRLPDYIENLTLLDLAVPDFQSFLLIPYGSSEQSVAGYGNELNNTLVGGRINNLLDGWFGADTLIGGLGEDTYIVDNIGDVVVEQVSEGTDSVLSAVSYQLSANVENLTLTGTAAIDGVGNALNNDIRGNDASNVLDGGAGDDGLLGFGGADTYRFGRGSGRDTVMDVSAEGEIDRIEFDATVTAAEIEVYRNGGSLELAIRGTTDELTLLSYFASTDYAHKEVRFADGTLWNSAELSKQALTGITNTGTFESETIVGSDGHDLLIGSAGNDVVTGGRGKDVLYGDLTYQPFWGDQIVGDDTLSGGAGDDLLVDFRGENLFDGGAGDDALTLGTGVDTVLFGRGAGVDVVTFDGNRNDIDIIEMADGISPADIALTWHSASGADLQISDSGDRLILELSTDWFAVGPETTQTIVRFADGTEWSLAWSSSNVDVPAATASSDLLTAPFPSMLNGLGGDDTYLLGSSGLPGRYAIIEEEGGGIDTIQSLFDYELDPYVENLILAESTSSVLQNPEQGTGNELNNLIIGNSKDNILDGGAGDDVLVGGVVRSVEEFVVFETGSDILIGGAGDDVLMADGGNIVFEANGVSASWLFLDGGSEFREDVLREADDTFIGGSGNDTYILHSQDQTVVELEHEGTDTVRSTVEYVLGNQVENLTLLEHPITWRPGPLVGTGNTLDNVLIGNSEDNWLSGESGNDTLWGGRGVHRDTETVRSGNDALRGGSGHDTYLFNLGDGTDTIGDRAGIGEGNRIQFGAGIARSSLTFIRDEAARTLTIQVGSTGTDQLILTDFDPTGTNGSWVVDTLAFADGSSVNLATLLSAPVNQAPTVANPVPDQTVLEDAPFSAQIPTSTFTDPDAGEVLTYSATLANGATLPTWLSFDATMRTFTGTPDDAQVGSLDLRVMATDTGNLSVSDTFTLTVQNVNDAPAVIVPLAAQTVLEDVSFSLTVPSATFTDQDVVHGDGLTYRATLAGGAALPAWLSFNPTTRVFSGTPLNGDVGTLALSVTATDQGNVSVSTGLTLTVQNVNDAPTVMSPIADQAGAEDSPFSFTVPGATFMDEDLIHGDVATYRATQADGRPLPIWLNFNPTTRTFSGTPGAGDAGTLELAITATDAQALSVTDTFALTVSGPLPLTVVGGSGSDVLTGGRGSDTLTGGVGNDTLAGGAGSDTYLFNLGDGVDQITDTSVAGEGNTVQFGAGITPNDLSLGIGSLLIRVGTNGDALHLTPFNPTDALGAHAIETFRFADGTVLSYAQLMARGFDLAGTSGSDTITGTSVVDRINGLAGNDTIHAGAGDDVLDGGIGVDTMVGGAGNDTYVVDVFGDVVTEAANEGIDTVESALLTYTLGANVENLLLMGRSPSVGVGNAANNGLMGNSGANLLDGRAGADTMAGGAGDDLYLVDHIGDLVVEQVNGGTDSVLASASYRLSADVENLNLTGSAAISGTGNEMDNVLTGNSAANVLTGLAGNDTYVIGAGDRVAEATNEGTDTVVSSVAHTLADNVENLSLVGISAISGTGNGLDNVLNGLLNLAGNTLAGGAGNDTYVVGTGDTVTEAANAGTDTVQSAVAWTLGANVENLILTGTTAINGTGNALDNVLTGNSAVNTLTGADGNDRLMGGQGNDTVNGGAGNDTYVFGRGAGRDLVQDNSGSSEKILYDAGINPLDLVISRQANDLRLSIHGSTDYVTVQNWYVGTSNRTETIQSGNGEVLLSTQVETLIQAMATFTTNTGLTWDQAAAGNGTAQQQTDFQNIIATNWQ